MIGQMRNKVVLQSMSPSTDSGGGQSVSWGTATTVWAKVENLSGTENSFGDQIEDRSNYRFTIRYYSSLTPKYRISYNSKTFNIQHIASLMEGKERYQVIQAEEGVAT
jgi:SPP1 family predicted phage head-tail adaptor|tara:strand:+ start:2654 stop:2977 length:324 start_codon:yes stop_codon:yes gene_type:complete